MNKMLVDKFSRQITYVRLAITDRCNLRCQYCMPEKMSFLPRPEILSYEEMERLLRILASNGVNKVRITGGEPFVRKDVNHFLRRITKIPGITRLHITTNGVTLLPHLEFLKEIGISDLNLSLDSLNRERFHQITRRDFFPRVWTAIERAVILGFRLKINMVVMDGVNTDEIANMATLAENPMIQVRFIEEMPFNGSGQAPRAPAWDKRRILHNLQESYPELHEETALPGTTADILTSPRLPGTLGIIAGYSRTFCGSCNRIRINARGELQTCLYGGKALDLKKLLREGCDNDAIEQAIRVAISARLVDGWAAQKANLSEKASLNSMSTIGG